MSSRNDPGQLVYVDAHVHIHKCFNLLQFFNSAKQNFNAISNKFGQRYSDNAILFLSESRGVSYFRRLQGYVKKEVNKHSLGSWKIERTEEEDSLIVRSQDKKAIILIAGSQIISKENIEILALSTVREFEDRIPLNEAVQRIIDGDGIPVLPWGVGKWFGKRGRILTQFLKENKNPYLFLGDNSGRPRFWPTPSHFRLGQELGLKVLPGSDPLPFPTQCRRPGSFGFIVEGEISRRFPAREMKNCLKNLTTSPQCFGDLENPIRFLKNQFIMQLRKIRSKATI